MVALIALPLACFAALALFGVALISPMRSGHRQVLLAATPVLGAAFLAVVLSATSWFVTAGPGIVIAVVIALTVTSVALARRRASFRFSRSAWLFAAATWVVGVFGAVLALGPSIAIGDSRVVMANGNHDAYYYASVASWFSRSTMSAVPIIGAVPGDGLLVPAFSPAASAYALPLRMGQPMVLAALTELLGSDPVVTTVPVMAVWVMLVPAAAAVGMRLLRTGPVGALAGGLVTTSSALLVYLVVNQNMDSLIGVSLAMMTMAATVAAAQGRLPRWPAAMVLAALVACYTEYAVFVAPAILSGLLLRRSPHIRRPIIRGAQILGLAVLMAPTAWLRGVRTLLFMTGNQSGDAGSSPLAPDGDWTWALRILGLATIRTTGSPSPPTVAVALILGVALLMGALLALGLARNRGVWVGVFVVGGGYVAYLTVSSAGYAQSRAVVLLLPLVLMGATAGWAAFLGRRSGRRSRVPTPALAVALAVVLGLWVAGNVRTAHREVDPVFAAARHVGVEYDEVRDWVAEFGGPGGAGVAVVVPDFVENMWINLALRDTDLVSYPVESGNYVSVFSYGDGRDDRYVIVGSGVGVAVDPAAVIRQNDRFRLIDRTVAGGTIVAPVDSADWNLNVQAGFGFVGSYGAELLVMRSPGSGSGSGSVPPVHLSAPHTTVPVPVQFETGGASATSAELVDGSSPVELPAGSTEYYTVTIARPPGADPQSSPSLAFQGFGDVG